MRLNRASFTAWVWLQLDVAVSVRRQNNQRILEKVSARTMEEESNAVEALENLESSVEADSTEALLSMDAVEVCGAPLKKHLDNFDAPCPKGKFQGGPMRIITAGRAQEDGPYIQPDNRLYVCNPNSKLRGALFTQGEPPKAIASGEELERTMTALFAEKLFKWETSYPNGTAHRRNGEEKKMVGNPKKIMIWVLDMDGNWIIGPEIQEGGLIVKHGDLTPGEYPWTRPKASLLQDSEQALAEDENPTVPEQKRLGGSYRGVARAGGEIHFYPEEGTSPDHRWLIEDSSSYAFFRVPAVYDGPLSEGEMSKEEVVEYVEDTAERDDPIGRCGIKRLEEYLKGPVGLELPGVKVMVTIVDPKTRERFYVDP